MWRTAGTVWLAVVVVAIDLDALEHPDRVLGENGGRAIERDQVGRGALLIDAHEADRKRRRDFARDAGLEQTDDTALLFAGAHEKDVGLLAADVQLVRRHERNAAPGDHRRAEQRDGWR